MTANEVWIEAIIQRPVIRLRTSSSASRSDSFRKRPASSSPRPIVLPSRIPETESDSCTRLEMSAIDSCRTFATLRRWSPTRLVSQTKSGSSASANSVSCQLRMNIATTVASTVVTFETIDVAVEVTTSWTPPMSFASRDCTSPVRVRVKNASERRCRCSYTAVRRSCITRWPTWFDSSVWTTPSAPVTTAIATMPATSQLSSHRSCSGNASSITCRSSSAGMTPSAEEKRISPRTPESRRRYGRKRATIRRR